MLDRSRDEVEAKHSESSLNLRKQIMKVEETIRLSERRSDRGIARGVAALESATERVRLLEGLPTAPEPPRRSSAEIERKLDELLREVADIKKELKRLREGK